MRSTGVTRKLDELGRVVLPIELRRNLNLNIGDAVEIYTQGEHIILKKYSPGCKCCNEMGELLNVDGYMICRSCARKFYELLKNENRATR